MRLVTFEAGEGQRLGAVADNHVFDLARLSHRDGGSSIPPTMMGFVAAGPEVWRRASQMISVAVQRLPSPSGGEVYPLAGVDLLAPIPRPAKNVFCLGLNYRAHLEESNRTMGRDLQPTVPVFFTKAVTSIVAPGGPILFDEASSVKYDWEAELGVVIGLPGRSVSPERAMDHVFGYTCFNDVSVRDLQSAHVQWFKGKSLDGTCPFGPWIVTAEEVPNPHNLDIQCRVNGVVKQSSNTALMIHDIPAMIYHLSRGMTLEAGDLISTGTPEGIGNARTPPEYLKPGDVVEVEIEGVGVLRNPVVDIREVE